MSQLVIVVPEHTVCRRQRPGEAVAVHVCNVLFQERYSAVMLLAEVEISLAD